MHHENEDENENDDNNNENDIPIISSKSKFTSSQGFSRSRRSSISSIRRAHWKKKNSKIRRFSSSINIHVNNNNLRSFFS